jgi:hypothetical protein
VKIARAKKHLAEFQTDLRAYMTADPIRLMVERPPEGYPHPEHHHAWTLRIAAPVPVELSAIIGDVIHNLRSGLDLLACDLVRLAGHSAKSVYFPFCEIPSDLPKMIKLRNFDRAGPLAVKLLKGLRPYRGGNLLLRAIHDLDVVDKHQSLVPAVSTTSSPGFRASFLGGLPTDVPPIHSRISHDGQLLVLMPELSDVHLGSKIPILIRFVFGTEAGDLAGQDMIETLEKFVGTTESVVELFRTEFAAPGSEPRD